jgi:molecular chaperone GrpE
VRPQDNKEQPITSHESSPAADGSGDATGQPEAQPEAPAPASENETADLKKQLDDCKVEADKYKDQWLRSAADFSNYKKRMERDQSDAKKYYNADLLTRLMPMLDDLDTAFANLPENLGSQPWIEGLRLIHRKFHSIFTQEGLQEIETVGQPFDPVLHEAITHEPSETTEEGHIISELRKGYRLNDRVLRPAQVRVSAGRLDR